MARSPVAARVIVKLPGSLTQGLAQSASATVSPGKVSTTAVTEPVLRALLVRHAVRTMAPLYPEASRVRQQAGVAGAVPQASMRQRFPARAARAASRKAPPDLSNIYVFDLGVRPAAEVVATIQSLRSDPNVLWAEEDRAISVSYVPNDPDYSSSGSWGQSYDDLYGLKSIGTAAAWDTTRGLGVIVAVIDTGVDYTHPDISANIWTNGGEIPGNGIDDDHNGFVDDVRGWDFVGPVAASPVEDNDPADVYGHGTHVAGTIAATGDNHEGVVGVAWQSKLMIVRGLDNTGNGYDSDLARAIVYAVDNGADVINASWGGSGFSQTETDAVAYAHAHGVVFVAAAGNSAANAADFSPASVQEAITVSAIDADDTLASFSNFGNKIDVTAPGVDILSLEAGTSGYVRMRGTSMAAPHVSGVAALIIAQHPDYTNEQVRQVLRASATDLGTPGKDQSFGYGRVSAALSMLVDQPLQASITSPVDGGNPLLVATPLVGTASGPGFDHYLIEFGAGTAPTSWITLASSTGSVVNGTLGAFDPTTLVDGIYTVRLQAFNAGGAVFTDQIQVKVRYLEITWPRTPTTPSLTQEVKPGTIYQIRGSARGPSFQSYVLEWAPGAAATTGWSTTGLMLQGGGLSPVADGVLGTWTPPSTLQGFYSLRLTVANTGFSSTTTSAFYAEPALLAGAWPQFVGPVGAVQSVQPVRQPDGTVQLLLCGATYFPSQLYLYASDGSLRTTPLLDGRYNQPAVADLDGQPGDEIVVPDESILKIFHSDLTLAHAIPTDPGNHFAGAPVILPDLDNDGVPEIVALGWNSDLSRIAIYIFHADGTRYSQNPPPNLSVNPGITPRIVAVDLDGDGQKEIVLGHENSTGTGYVLKAFNADGSDYAAWSTLTFSDLGLTEIAAADLDREGKADLIITEYNQAAAADQIRIINGAGTVRAGWPVAFPGRERGMAKLAIGDLDRDQHMEIVVAAETQITVLRDDGTLWRPAWSNGGNPQWCTSANPVIADLDGDGSPEILAATSSINFDDPHNLYFYSALTSYRSDGTVMRSWPLFGLENRQPFLATPLVGDFNGDGKTDIAINLSLRDKGQTFDWLVNSAIICLTLDAPYAGAGVDWGSNFHDPQNSGVARRAPVITRQPGDQGFGPGQAATFTVAADGSPIPLFQWQIKQAAETTWSSLANDGHYSGARTSALHIMAASLEDDFGDQFRCIVANSAGATTSNGAAFAKMEATVTLDGLNAVFDGMPKIPTATTNPAGKIVTFTYNGSTTVPVEPGSYAVVATIIDANYSGSASGTLVITNNAPAITSQVTARNVIAPGANLTLSPTFAPAFGTAYQWYHNGSPINGAVTGSLFLTNVTYASRGAYWVVASNDQGTVRSNPVFVVVAPTRTQIRGWGQNSNGVLDLPAGLTTAVEVKAGVDHALALKTDGTVVAWGNNAAGATTIPAGLTDVVAIGAGAQYSVALKSDGTVVAWGEPSSGRTAVPPNLGDVVSLSVGAYHTLALKADGTVVGWGWNIYGQATVPANLTGVTAVAAGQIHSLALKMDGTVVGWGYNDNGLLDLAASFSNIVAISAGAFHSLVIKADGTVTAWGPAAYGDSFDPPASLIGVIDGVAGFFYSIVLKDDGTIFNWQTGTTAIEHQIPFALNHVIDVDTKQDFSLALRDTANDVAPAITAHPLNQMVTAGRNAQFAVTASGTPATAYQWQIKQSGESAWNNLDNDSHYSGTQSFTLQVANVILANDSGDQFRCVVTNGVGSVTSNAAMLTVGSGVNGLSYGSSNFPMSAGAGAVVSFSYTVTNAGTKTWGANHYLVLRDAAGTLIADAPLATTASGAGKAVTLTFTAPVTTGSYIYKVEAVENGVEWFGGQQSLPLTVSVAATPPNAITYGAKTFPASTAAGSIVSFTYTVTNVGTKTWGANHFLVLKNTVGTPVADAALATTAAGASKTVTLTFTAPATPGSYAYKAEAVENGVEWFGGLQSLPALTVSSTTTPANAIGYGLQTFPGSAVAGSSVSFTYVVMNAGTKTWGANHFLVLKNATGGMVADAALGTTVAGASKAVTLTFTAPAMIGSYTYRVEAVENGVEWFGGAQSLPAPLTVTPAPPLQNSIDYGANTFPASAAAGMAVSFTYTVTNTGAKTWGANHFLVLKNAAGTPVADAALATTAAGASKTVTLTFNAPATTGSYAYKVEAVENGVEFFGGERSLPALAVTTAASPPNAISYGARTFPSIVTAGDGASLAYTVTNTGTKTWGANHFLVLKTGSGSIVADASLATTAGGASKMVTMTFIAPAIAGSYNYKVEAVENGVEWFGGVQSLPPLSAIAADDLQNGISYEASNFPPNANVGATVSFSFSVANAGTKPWGANHFLVLKNPAGTILADAALGATAPGATKTVGFTFTAPGAGVHTYHVQAVENGVEWFGFEYPLNLAVGSISQLYAFSLDSSNLPDGMTPGMKYYFRYNVTNTGPASWTDSRLTMTLKDAAGTIFGSQALLAGSPIAPGTRFSGYMPFTAPAMAALYQLHFEGSVTGEGLFAQSEALPMTVYDYNLSGTPQIITQPQGRLMGLAQNIVFNVRAAGTVPTTYQWQKKPAASVTWTNLTEDFGVDGRLGTETEQLTLYHLLLGAIGDSYRCVITTPHGSVISEPVVIDMLPAGSVLTNALVFNGTVVPPSVATNDLVDLACTVTNTGTKNWENGHYLVLKDAEGNIQAMASVAATPIGGSVNAYFAIISPGTAGIYAYRIEGLENGSVWFGQQDITLLVN